MGITVRRLQEKDERKVFSLIKRTFLKYNSIGLSQRVIGEYLSFLSNDTFPCLLETGFFCRRM
jgi:hypothetical protein